MSHCVLLCRIVSLSLAIAFSFTAFLWRNSYDYLCFDLVTLTEQNREGQRASEERGEQAEAGPLSDGATGRHIRRELGRRLCIQGSHEVRFGGNLILTCTTMPRTAFIDGLSYLGGRK